MEVLLFDEPVKISAERLQASYLVCLREILGRQDENTDEANKEAGNLNILATNNDSAEEAEEEQLNAVDEIDTCLVEENGEMDKKPAAKRKVRGAKRTDADYDLDDPFIDDSEIQDTYFSVFEMMRNAPDSIDESCSDNEIGPEPLEDTEHERGSIKRRFKNMPERNYFVYRGLLTPEVLSREFHMPLEDVLAGFSMGSAESSNAVDKEGRGYDASDAENNGGQDSSATDEVNRKKRRKTAESEASKPKKARKAPEQGRSEGALMIGKADRKQSKKSAGLLKRTTDLFSKVFDAEDGNSNSSSGKQSQPASPVKKPSAGAAIAGPAAPLPIVFDVSNLDNNILELRLAFGKFQAAAKATEIQAGKFPSALRAHLDESLLVSLRAWPFLLASGSGALIEESLSQPLPAFLSQSLASFLPFSPAAVERLLVRKIMLPLRISIHNAIIPQMVEQWKEGVAKRLKEPGAVMTMASKESAILDGEAGAVEVVPAAETSLSQKRMQRLKFNDELRQLIFEIVRAEGDLVLLDQALSKVRDEDAAATEQKLDEPQDKPSTAAVATIPLPNDLTMRRQVWNKLLHAVSSVIDPAFLNATDLNREYTAHRRKHEKRIGKLAGEMVLAEEVNCILGPHVENARKKATLPVPPVSAVEDKPASPLAGLFDDETTRVTGADADAGSASIHGLINVD